MQVSAYKKTIKVIQKINHSQNKISKMKKELTEQKQVYAMVSNNFQSGKIKKCE